MDEQYDIDSGSLQGLVKVLGAEECWQLLRSWSLGRIAISVQGRPEIFPINYAVDEGTVVVRTSPGTKLLGLTANERVAFEADDYDEHEARSVLITGTAHILSTSEEIDHADGLPLVTWAPTVEHVYVRITPLQITGRRISRDRPAEE
jgi:hypothetical protein